MLDLFGEVPTTHPEVDQIIALLESKGIRRGINRQQAKTMLKIYTLDQITAGIVWGSYLASIYGSKPTRLNYFRGSVEKVTATGPDYVRYLLRRQHVQM